MRQELLNMPQSRQKFLTNGSNEPERDLRELERQGLPPREFLRPNGDESRQTIPEYPPERSTPLPLRFVIVAGINIHSPE